MSESTRIKILSVDNHPLMREGIAAVRNEQPDLLVVAQAATGRESIQQFRVYQPDITLLDLRLPDMGGIEIMMAIQKEFPEARIIMLTTFDGDVEIQRSLAAGARGYLLKSMSPQELVEGIRQVHAGRKRVPAEIAAHLFEYLGKKP